ncbi:hypothetical protein JK358_13115 [Nocardia sp. 2]|uniref:Ig-like domain-containing protein n=1 Tax=Nocardia acididurans TaxID=2802282 RepID=A0ABS1M560_9NOCA|nr:hypothetical protein [Nocardia acididurans]MBL1075334.1 hypothetical protein [Nocardia acididurans]
MITTSRTWRNSLLVLAACGLPIALAPTANAQIDSVEVKKTVDWENCGLVGAACEVIALTSGADKANPVTMTLNGVPFGERTPYTAGWDGAQYQARFWWVPSKAGTYTIVVNQGASSRTTTFSVCSESAVLSGSAAAVVCKLTGGSSSGSR